MSSEFNSVLEVEKHECLYNFKLPEYSRRDVIEKAWSEIAKSTQMSVCDSKEKWRNIRSSFLRSMKVLPSGSKPRKSYYLKDHLQFVLPYLKPINNAVNSGNIPLHSMETAYSVISDYTEELGNDNHDTEPTVNNDVSPNIPTAVLQTDFIEGTPNRRRKRKNTPEIKKSFKYDAA